MRSAILRNEKFQPLRGVQVELFDPDTGKILETALTNQSGFISFNTTGRVAMRPRITRYSGKLGRNSLPLTGAVNLYQNPLSIPPVPLPAPEAAPLEQPLKKPPVAPFIPSLFLGQRLFSPNRFTLFQVVGSVESQASDSTTRTSFGPSYNAWHSRLDGFVFWCLFDAGNASPNFTVYKTSVGDNTGTSFTGAYPTVVSGPNNLSVAEGNNGTIYVAGGYDSPTVAGTWLQRYQADGTFINELTFDEADLFITYRAHVIIGRDGSVYLARMSDDDSPTTGGIITKYDPSDMSVIWSIEPGDSDDLGGDVFTDIDEEGNIYVARVTLQANDTYRNRIFQYDSNGNLLNTIDVSVDDSLGGDAFNYHVINMATGQADSGEQTIYLQINSFDTEPNYISVLLVDGTFKKNIKTFNFLSDPDASSDIEIIMGGAHAAI